MKRTLYPKLLAGYLMYGLIGFLIITTFTYHITFAFVEKKDAASLYRESALISSNYAGNYFSKTMTLNEIQTQLSTLSIYLSSEIWIVDTHRFPASTLPTSEAAIIRPARFITSLRQRC